MPPLLALDAIDGAIGGFPVGLPIQRDPDRKAAWCIVPHDLNAADGLAAGPLSYGVEALLRHKMRPRRGHGQAFSVD